MPPFLRAFILPHTGRITRKAARFLLNRRLETKKKNSGGTFLADRLPEEAVTLAEVLKAAGYRTGGIGSGPWLKPVFWLDQGFDFYDCRVQSTKGRSADQVNALAVPFIRRHAGRPFFLFLNYFDPHDPYDPPPAFTFKFFPKNRLKEVRTDPAAKKESIIARYDAEIFFMDLQIGRIVNELKELNLYHNTCIFVVGDHGEHLGEHQLWKHGHSLFEEVIRSPMIIKWPEKWAPVPPGSESCQHVDLMPTLLKRLKIDPPVSFEGDCLGELNHPIVCELHKNIGQVKREGPRFDRDLTAIYHDGYKLILSSKNKDPDAGLYDIQKDPAETLNLFAVHDEIVTSLKTELDQWRASLQKPLVPEKVDTLDPRTLDQLKALGYAD